MSKTIKEWTDEIERLVEVQYGGAWQTWDQAPKLLMYLVTECSEAMEAWRDDDQEHFGEELADIAIRLFDTARQLHYDLEEEIDKKMKINWTREWQHGRVNV